MNTKEFKIKRLLKGDTFYDYRGNLNHIVNIFTDENLDDIVVYKYWIKGRGWKYEADSLKILIFKICILYDNLSDKSKSNDLRKQFFNLNNIEYEI